MATSGASDTVIALLRGSGGTRAGARPGRGCCRPRRARSRTRARARRGCPFNRSAARRRPPRSTTCPVQSAGMALIARARRVAHDDTPSGGQPRHDRAHLPVALDAVRPAVDEHDRSEARSASPRAGARRSSPSTPGRSRRRRWRSAAACRRSAYRSTVSTPGSGARPTCLAAPAPRSTPSSRATASAMATFSLNAMCENPRQLLVGHRSGVDAHERGSGAVAPPARERAARSTRR